MSVYLDYQATTPMPEQVKEAYLEALGVVGNPSALHQAGQRSRAMLEDARERVATALDCEPVEVVFTSGGTEAINTVLKGTVWARQQADGPGAHTSIAATAAEHHATLDALTWLADHEATTLHTVAVDSFGVMDLDHLETILATGEISVLTTLVANNEVGSLQPVAQMVERARAHGVPVHADAVAALGYLPLSFRELGVDAMSVSAHKVGGPVGVGALVLARPAPDMQALHHGGNQQRVRSGTLDVAGAVAFAAALEYRQAVREASGTGLLELRQRLTAGLLGVSEACVLRGSVGERLPGNLNITVAGCKGDVLLFLLDGHGVQASTGSACQAGVPEPSHVLRAMGVPIESAWGALRFSLSYATTAADVDRVIEVFPDVVHRAQKAGLSLPARR